MLINKIYDTPKNALVKRLFKSGNNLIPEYYLNNF